MLLALHFSARDGGGSLPLVAAAVETHEQAEEHEILPQDNNPVYPRVPAVYHERDATMEGQHDELHQLQLCQVPLPPQVFLNCGAEER